MKSVHKHFGGLDDLAILHKAQQDRYDFEEMRSKVRCRQERLEGLGRRAAIQVVVRVLDENIRRAEIPFVPPPKIYSSDPVNERFQLP